MRSSSSERKNCERARITYGRAAAQLADRSARLVRSDDDVQSAALFNGDLLVVDVLHRRRLSRGDAGSELNVRAAAGNVRRDRTASDWAASATRFPLRAGGTSRSARLCVSPRAGTVRRELSRNASTLVGAKKHREAERVQALR